MTATIDVSSHLVMQALAHFFPVIGLLIYIVGVLIVLMAARIRFARFRDFLHHEMPTTSWVAWTLACFLYAVLPAELFWDLYSVSYQSEAAPYLFNILTLYMVIMALWGLACYLFMWRQSCVNTILGVGIVVAFVVAAWTTYEFHSNHHVHVALAWLLLLPPILALFTCHTCYTFRHRYSVAIAKKRKTPVTHKTSSHCENPSKDNESDDGELTLLLDEEHHFPLQGCVVDTY